jgi:hypothetical protein
MVPILCTHVCNGKMRLVDAIPGVGGVGIKENSGGGEFNCDVL